MLVTLAGGHAFLCGTIGWRLGTSVFGAEQQQHTLEMLRLVSTSPWSWVPQKLLFPVYALALVWAAALPGYLGLVIRGNFLPATLWPGLLLAGGVGLLLLASGLTVPPERVGMPRFSERLLPVAKQLELHSLRSVQWWLAWQALHLGYVWIGAASVDQPVRYRLHFLFRMVALQADQLFWGMLALYLLCGLTCAWAWANPVSPAAARLRVGAQLLTVGVGYLLVIAITWVGSLWFWQAILVAFPLVQLVRLALERRKLARVRRATRRDDPRAQREIAFLKSRWDNPVLIRDLRVSLRGGGLAALFFRQWLVIGVIAGGFSALMLSGPWGAAVGPSFLNILTGFMAVILGWGSFVTLLRLGAPASAQWNAERRMRTLPQLLLSPLGSREIVVGRWSASLLQGVLTALPWVVGNLVCTAIVGEGRGLWALVLTGAWLVSMALLFSLALSVAVRELSSWRELWSVTGCAIAVLVAEPVVMVWGMTRGTTTDVTMLTLCILFTVVNTAALPVVLTVGSGQLDRQRQRLFE
ncbi:MAG: hypothetical protein K0Q72_3875 [Armatimonadetes bacterium]|nr:hypothetical protein [Armatimonadota bacterium]